MKTLFKYITIIVGVLTVASCSVDDFNISGGEQDGYIEFIPRPTAFTSYDVSSNPTKAVPSESAPTDVEKRIVQAYFLVFGENGSRIGAPKTCELTESNQIVPEKLWHNSENGKLTVCYLANVTQTYAQSLDDLSYLSDPEYAYEITYATRTSADDPIGIPTLDGESCFPMFGMITDVEPDPNGNCQKTIPLKRLFAKVYVGINWETQINGDNLLADQGFILNYYRISNLPKYVLLNADSANEESKWVSDESCFVAPITVSNSQSTSLLSNIELTFYTPEYVLLPNADAVAAVNTQANALGDDTKKEKLLQKSKPTLFDTDKNPLCLSIDGIVQSTDFVNVPLEYTIYLGENAFDSFTLRRNNQYNNKITITGTGDAILGTDHRVEATYHNLADPNNTGTDNPANCYIIGRPGRYLIPTYKGNSSEMLGGIDISKTVTYSDGKNSITNLDFFTDESGKNWLIFDVNMTVTDGAISDLPAIENGNTVLEFKNASGNTVWSWHLWFTSGGILGSEWGGISSETYDGTNAVMMTHNIGASEAGSDGLYYLWGDKDPYFTPSGKSAGYYGNVATGSWSANSKSVTDPCPPGYRVPSNAVWLSESAWKATSAGADGAQLYSGSGFFYDLNPSVMFPFSSYLNGNTKVTHGYSEWSKQKENKDFGGTIYYRERYQLVDGLFWTSTQNQCLYYGVKKMEAEALGALWGNTISIDPSSSYWKFVSGIANKVVEWVIAKDKSVYQNPGTSEFITLNNTSGAQVRCVSETSPVQ